LHKHTEILFTKYMSENKSIKFGDPRIFFESTTTAPFDGPSGIHYDAGAIVRGSARIEINGKNASVSLPSMAELIYYQSDIALKKASRIKTKALRIEVINNFGRVVNEQDFFTYMQLCSVGILGLYSSLEAMVYELYIRKYKENVVKIDGKALTEKQFTSLGIERKLTSVASQLSGKSNIYGTVLLKNAKQLISLRTTIDLIEQIVEFALSRNYDVILEGILYFPRYGEMLKRLVSKCPHNYFFYFDVSFEETLNRHATKQNAHEFGETEMREWYKPNQLTHFKGEQVIPELSTIEETVNHILEVVRL
jgi:hypothetical protein